MGENIVVYIDNFGFSWRHLVGWFSKMPELTPIQQIK